MRMCMESRMIKPQALPVRQIQVILILSLIELYFSCNVLATIYSLILWSFSNPDQDLQEPQGRENDVSGKQILVLEPDPWKIEKESLVDVVEVYIEKYNSINERIKFTWICLTGRAWGFYHCAFRTHPHAWLQLNKKTLALLYTLSSDRCTKHQPLSCSACWLW